MTLPTEEDVLAVLVLWASRPVVTNIYDSAQVAERNDYDKARRFKVRLAVALLASERRQAVESLEIAITDSERRLEVERATEAVLMAAEEWRDSPTMLASSGLASAIDRLRSSEGR